ncbi:MAG: hypothetical protein GX879_07160, partial [Bacteroidales bacterium]|nr:hypothetical protein [Bacteroidales bacterium]
MNHRITLSRNIRNILFLIAVCFNNVLYSQQLSPDTLIFYNAQEKITSSESGKVNFKLNYVTTNSELYWDVEFYYLKLEDDTKYFYISQKDDSITNRYAYYNDTALLISESNNGNYREPYFSKRYIKEPFSGNIRKTIFEVIDGNALTLFLNYDDIELFDSICTINGNEIIVGKASSVRKEKYFFYDLENYYKYEVALNKNDNKLIRRVGEVTMYEDTEDKELFYKSYKEFIIDTMEVYNFKNPSIKDKVISEYLFMDSIISQQNLPEITNTVDTVQKEIPKHAYPWALPLIGGDTLHSNTINSKIIVLDFYYTSCGPCILDIRNLVKLDSLFNDSDVCFIGIN